MASDYQWRVQWDLASLVLPRILEVNFCACSLQSNSWLQSLQDHSNFKTPLSWGSKIGGPHTNKFAPMLDEIIRWRGLIENNLVISTMIDG